MDLYLGAPFPNIHSTAPGYALAHEMTGNTIIEKYKPLSKLILDNGADELGSGQSGMRLAYLAGRLQPNFLILPDVLHKDKLTRQKGEKFFEQMQGSGYRGHYMGVIQAKTLDKGLKSYEWWVKSGMVDRIGITYDTQIPNKKYKEFEWGNRLNFLVELSRSRIYNNYPMGLHLLGTLDVNELYVLNHYAEFSDIVENMIYSHDTTMPYACDTPFVVTDYDISLGRKKDYLRLNFKNRLEGERLSIANWNVAAYLTACKIEPSKWFQYLGHASVELFSSFEGFYG
jgi:hypothetical protein